MNEFIACFLKKKKKEQALSAAIASLMAALAILSFVLCVVYFEQIGRVLYYSLSISSLLIFGFGSIFCFIEMVSSHYLISFFISKGKDSKKVKTEISEISMHTVDRHFGSYKVKGEDGFFYWAAPLGKVPLAIGKRYSLLVWGAWIVGWREEK